LTFGILQILGESPFTERNVTFGWIYISISMTVAAFIGMHIGLGLNHLISSYNQHQPTRIQMEEIGSKFESPNEIDLSDPNDRNDLKDKRVRFDFNNVVII
jgi:hypothetical protein